MQQHPLNAVSAMRYTWYVPAAAAARRSLAAWCSYQLCACASEAPAAAAVLSHHARGKLSWQGSESASHRLRRWLHCQHLAVQCTARRLAAAPGTCTRSSAVLMYIIAAAVLLNVIDTD
jgi:hypothetical protein